MYIGANDPLPSAPLTQKPPASCSQLPATVATQTQTSLSTPTAPRPETKVVINRLHSDYEIYFVRSPLL